MAVNIAPDQADPGVNYFVRESVGKGAFGDVFLVVHRTTNVKYVLKKIRLARQTEWQRNSTMQEIKLVSSLQHPYVVPYVESWIHHGHTVNIVYGYCEKGDLGTYIMKQKNKMMDEEQLKYWAAQLLLALDYMHKKYVLHRDVKSSNIFLTSGGDVQIGDFGLATVRDASDDGKHDQSLVGTPSYMSPELLSQKKYGFKTDIWSLGCVMYELSALRPAFNAFNLHGLVSKIKRSGIAPLPKEYSPEWHALIKAMLRKDPASRPSVEQLLGCAFLQPAIERARQRAMELMPDVQLPPQLPVWHLSANKDNGLMTPGLSTISSNGGGDTGHTPCSSTLSDQHTSPIVKFPDLQDMGRDTATPKLTRRASEPTLSETPTSAPLRMEEDDSSKENDSDLTSELQDTVEDAPTEAAAAAGPAPAAASNGSRAAAAAAKPAARSGPQIHKPPTRQPAKPRGGGTVPPPKVGVRGQSTGAAAPSDRGQAKEAPAAAAAAAPRATSVPPPAAPAAIAKRPSTARCTDPGGEQAAGARLRVAVRRRIVSAGGKPPNHEEKQWVPPEGVAESDEAGSASQSSAEEAQKPKSATAAGTAAAAAPAKEASKPMRFTGTAATTTTRPRAASSSVPAQGTSVPTTTATRKLRQAISTREGARRVARDTVAATEHGPPGKAAGKRGGVAGNVSKQEPAPAAAKKLRPQSAPVAKAETASGQAALPTVAPAPVASETPSVQTATTTAEPALDTAMSSPTGAASQPLSASTTTDLSRRTMDSLSETLSLPRASDGGISGRFNMELEGLSPPVSPYGSRSAGGASEDQQPHLYQNQLYRETRMTAESDGSSCFGSCAGMVVPLDGPVAGSPPGSPKALDSVPAADQGGKPRLAANPLRQKDGLEMVLEDDGCASPQPTQFATPQPVSTASSGGMSAASLRSLMDNSNSVSSKHEATGAGGRVAQGLEPALDSSPDGSPAGVTLASQVAAAGAEVRESFKGFRTPSQARSAATAAAAAAAQGQAMHEVEEATYASPLAMWLGSNSEGGAAAARDAGDAPSAPLSNSERRRLIMLERVVSLAGQLYEKGRWQELGAVLSSTREVDLAAAKEALSKALQQQQAGKGGKASLQLGASVTVGPRALSGTVKFMGVCHWDAGEYVGVQLAKPADSTSDGCVDGIRYFHCPPQHGMFVRAELVSLQK